MNWCFLILQVIRSVGPAVLHPMAKTPHWSLSPARPRRQNLCDSAASMSSRPTADVSPSTCTSGLDSEPAESENVSCFSRVRIFVTPWTVAHQALLSVEFSRQEYWSGLPFPSPGDLPNPGIEPGFRALGADALLCEPPVKCLSLLPPSYKGPCDHSGPTWIIQDNLLISRSLTKMISAKSLLPCKVTSSKVAGTGPSASLGVGIIQPTAPTNDVGILPLISFLHTMTW